MFFALHSNRKSMKFRFLSSVVLTGLFLAGLHVAQGQQSELKYSAPARLLAPIDDHALITLKGNVRRDLTPDRDLGPVEDSMPLHLYLVLQRTPEQQIDLETLVARQQDRTAPEYHKWLTPKQFGARFGANPEDVAKVTGWLQSHGFEVRSVLNNASMIDFATTAGQLRDVFHAEMHYWNMPNGKFAANATDPQIPAALAPVVAGVMGMDKIPPHMNRTPNIQTSYDKETHTWHKVNPTPGDALKPDYYQGGSYLLVAPQDLYTIYNINPVFNGGNLGAKATVAVVEETDIEYGTVTNSVAAGGDVTTFRTLFGVPGTLNMHVYHGYGSVTCNDPGIDPSGNGEDGEASLDAEWANATAPSANLIFMSCDSNPDGGIFSSMAALIDNNLGDVLSLSYGNSELNFTSSSTLWAFQDGLYAQAATQGQTIFISAGDSGSDVKDQNTSGTAASGINVSAFGTPMVTVAGGTDFQDQYDNYLAGIPLSNYWSQNNSQYYGDALSYIPETSWNGSCASSIAALYWGKYYNAGALTPAEYCNDLGSSTDGSVVGGSGGISTHYSVPAWQTGTSGYSNAYRSQPDISGFASNGIWDHYLLDCDSHDASSACTSASTFGGAGGTSFVAPYLAGVTGLLVNYTGERQGLLNPTLYALAKAQYTAGTNCYSNGQSSNTGTTTALPASSCIFNDVTTSNNDVPCAATATDCYVNSGASYGLLSTTGSSSLTVAYASAPGFDQVTGLGTLNVANLISKWNTAFTSSTALKATATTITSSQSTTLTATVTGGAPANYVDTPPAVTGSVTFKSGTGTLGSCTLSSGSCTYTVEGSSLATGSNSISATFAGSGTYPSSVSSVLTITVTSGSVTPSVLTSPTPGGTLPGPNATFVWTSVSGASGYWLFLGTTGYGSKDLLDTGETTATSYTYSKLPLNGEKVYATVYTMISGTLYHNYYAYYAATQSSLATPAQGATLAGPTVTFDWSTAKGTNIEGYWLFLGTTGVGSKNIYDSGETTAKTATLTNMPVAGGTIYARIYTSFNGTLAYKDYTYTAAKQAELVQPVPSTTLSGTTVTFNWSAATGTNVEGYWLFLGTTGVGSKNIYDSGETTATTKTVSGLPSSGTIYARVYTSYNGQLVYKDYTYTGH